MAVRFWHYAMALHTNEVLAMKLQLAEQLLRDVPFTASPDDMAVHGRELDVSDITVLRCHEQSIQVARRK